MAADITGYALEFFTDSATGTLAPSAFLAALIPFIILAIIAGIAFYIYTAWAFYAIAKKLKTEPAWLSWIPIANLYLYSKMAKMHWWPILLLAVAIIPIVGSVGVLILTIFTIIWYWKIFEFMGRPGWWAILGLIPFVGPILFAVFLGITAWGQDNKITQIRKKKR